MYIYIHIYIFMYIIFIYISYISLYTYITKDRWNANHILVRCGICSGMSHVTYTRVLPLLNESCAISTSHATYEWVAYEWVMSHMNTGVAVVAAHMNELCVISMSVATYQYGMSHIHGSYHIWMSHVTHKYRCGGCRGTRLLCRHLRGGGQAQLPRVMG